MLGHSFGANVAFEMGAGGHFDGAVILLAPSFSREDEVKALGIINRIGYVPGVRSGVEPVLSRSYRKMLDGHVPEERLDALAAEVATSRWPEMRMIVRRYFEYLDRHGTLAGRLCRSGVSAEVVFGEEDDVELTAAERGQTKRASAQDRYTRSEVVHRERGRRFSARARCFTNAGVGLMSRRRSEIAHRVR